MFCYGITGAGKTYTMPGPQLCPVPSPVPFAAAGTIFLGSRDIFRKAKGKRSQLPPTRQLRRMLSTQNIGQLSSRLRETRHVPQAAERHLESTCCMHDNTRRQGKTCCGGKSNEEEAARPVPYVSPRRGPAA